MPTYQYCCTECGHELEAVQKFSDDSLTVCPNCEGLLRKRFSAVGVVFKGSGFYSTDNRPQNGSKSKGDTAEANTNGDDSKSKSGDKSDTSSSTSESSGSDKSGSSAGSDSGSSSSGSNGSGSNSKTPAAAGTGSS